MKIRLSDICHSITDGDHQPPPKAKCGIPFVTISNIDQSRHTLDFTDTSFVPMEYYEGLADERRARKNDVLYSAVGSFGIPVLIKNDKRFVFQRHIAILRPNEKVVPEYLLYTMMNPRFYHWADSVAMGAAQRTVTLTQLRNKEVDIPPLSEQQRIAGILSAYDALIENNHKQIKLLEEAEQRLYKEWFIDLKFPGHETTLIDPTTNLPEGWHTKELGNLVPIRTGKRDANFGSKNGHFLFFTCAQEPIRADSYSFDGNAIILSGNGDFSVHLYRGKFEAYQRTYVLIPPNKANLFISFAAISSAMSQLVNSANGSTIKYLTKRMIEGIPVICPQDGILEQFNSVVEAIQSKIEVLEFELKTAREARDRLLPKLISGETEVQS